MLNYAASPLAPRQHGPQLDIEWWTSSDGLRWERPARGVNALEVFPQVPRLETHPLILNGNTGGVCAQFAWRQHGPPVTMTP